MIDNRVKQPLYHPYLDIWNELCLEIDRVLITPIQLGGSPDPYKLNKMFQRFGTWDTWKQEIDQCMSDESYYRTQYDEMETEKDEVQTKFCKLQEEIAGVCSGLEGIPELDDEEYSVGCCLISVGVVEEINDGVQNAIKALDELADDDWTYKKTKNKRK